MTLPCISPQDAYTKIKDGARLIDIRSADEYAHKHIQNARSLPLATLTSNASALTGDAPIIFHCLSGMRTQQHSQSLRQLNAGELYILEGGMQAWEKAGLPIVKNTRIGLDIMRQVQIAAGLLVVIGVLLGTMLSPWFYALSGFVGVGLMFAGITGFCGMARLLMCMPWNRSDAHQASQ